MCNLSANLKLTRENAALVEELGKVYAEIEELENPPEPQLPIYTTWGAQRSYLVSQLALLGVDPIALGGMILDAWYYYTNLDGWAKILPDLVFNSNLYRTNKFDCEDYALKASVICAERYGLNSFRTVMGERDGNGHSFNVFPYGEETGTQGWLLWEPNDGYEWAGQAFEIGENGYIPKLTLI